MKEIPAIILLLVFCIYGCNNGSQPAQQDEVMRKFDSVNHSLQQTDRAVESSARDLYKMLEKKWAGTDKAGSLQQFRYHIHDFYGYMADLKYRFYTALGDSTGSSMPSAAEDNMDISNRFFMSDEAAWVLEEQLKNVQKVFTRVNSDTALNNKIERLTNHPGKDFNKGWFYNVPPVAALTILNKFENDVRTIEARLLEHLLAE